MKLTTGSTTGPYCAPQLQRLLGSGCDSTELAEPLHLLVEAFDRRAQVRQGLARIRARLEAVTQRVQLRGDGVWIGLQRRSHVCNAVTLAFICVARRKPAISTPPITSISKVPTPTVIELTSAICARKDSCNVLRDYARPHWLFHWLGRLKRIVVRAGTSCGTLLTTSGS